ncbi:MAG: NUDIX domain-containing protein [Verrucomicrobiae bacterium]|nr:NUDIX domain-containing protein [Verrucomicrobiae bacterium]
MLMLHRRQNPNRGFWSPFGGKLQTRVGESPHQCAARETFEETRFRFAPEDFHLAGIVSEQGYEGETHWLMFLFELKPRLNRLPPPHEEGDFEFVPLDEVPQRRIPLSDRNVLWPLFQKNRGGFFAVSIHCEGPDGATQSWRVEQEFSASPPPPLP